MKRKGISGLIVALIMLGIAVGGGGLVYAVFENQAYVASIDNTLEIKSMKLVTNTADEPVISATVKNIGDTEINAITLSLNADTDTTTDGIQQFTAVFSPASLKPGQTSALSLEPVINSTNDYMQFNIGDTIQYAVSGTTSSGSTPQATSSVLVSLS